MRLVLSRKGVDSSSGGIPSPIMPDGTLVPLPIPSRYGPKTYTELSVNGYELGPLVGDLAPRMKPKYLCHLDPDLDARSCPRPDGWRPAFGQIESAQVHLGKHGIGTGDLFLFFGWFRQVEKVGARWRFARNAPNLHVLFGWLTVGETVPLVDKESCVERLAAYRDHPHLHIWDRTPNCLYIAGDKLKTASGQHRGAGLFGKFADSRVLTDTSQSNRSVWKLPAWFHPEKGTSLSYHEDGDRWQKAGNSCVLQSVARGQEFVLNVSDQAPLQGWLGKIFADAS